MIPLRLLFIALLVVFGCEDEPLPLDCAGVEGGNNICGCTDSTATNYDSTATFDDDNCLYDTTPPTVSISSHSSDQTVNEVVTITVTTQDNEGISKVEFFIDDSLVFTDTESPYQYDWNTTNYDDTSYTVKVISYDTSDNFTESEPTMLVVDNRVVYLWGEYYSVLNTTELDLYNNQLTGSIPSEIGQLMYLTTLDLRDNQLTGLIPSEIWDMTNLTHLYLGRNQLTGFIPPEIGNLTNLTHLYLGRNQLTGSIPPEIGQLTNLTRLYLYNNRLTGSIPHEIGNLSNITMLLSYDNYLTGSIPPEIGNLTNLTHLYLSGNKLTGEIPPEIWDMSE